MAVVLAEQWQRRTAVLGRRYIYSRGTMSAGTGSATSRIHVLGAGAVGLLFAAHLRQAGHPITLLLRSQSAVDRFERQGSRISVINDWVRVHPSRRLLLQPGEDITPCTIDGIQAEDIHTDNDQQGVISKLVVATKAQDTLQAFGRVRMRLGAQSTVVLLQNGMGVFEAIQREFYTQPDNVPAFIVGTNAHGCLRASGDEFVTRHTAMGSCTFATRPALAACGAPDSALELMTALAELPLDVAVVNWSELHVQLLLKLAANAVINPATALAGCHNGLMSSHDMSTMSGFMTLACAEIAAIYARAHPHLHEELSAHAIEEYVTRIVQVTAQNRSSMLQDVASGRPTEVDWINGHLVRLAHQHGVSAPINTALLALIKLREAAFEERLNPF
ncbi:2-dehydropantoate 2-reductase (Ketopantoate reductase) (KPA reductase) (KPR) [Coemansia sp. RSA 1807]|nr:2-dehydropantoate 2-reductase (Ketopantoate reductase) (KPA reductase) (KPR) [Coemansia sp. RSA 564]KAJ2576858.1 2-dehydropantoate 2-reductase (Ketopantoate reductase) (KPA reductase) (KPR) [Coemansia sp. RSA 1807]